MAALDDEIDGLLSASSDDSEIDDLLAAKPTATKSDAAPAQNAAPPEDEQQTRIRKLLEDSNKTFGMNNEALLAGMVRIPALGFRQDLGQFGAAIMDKAMGSEIPFGDLVKRAKPQVEKYYGDLEKEHPVASGVGAAVGGLPMAMAVNPATAGVARLAGATKMAPWLAKTLGIGAAGLDNAAMAGVLRLNETGDTDKALDDAKLAGAMGSAFSAAPLAYRGAKAALGKGAQLPRKGLDGLAKMLGTADDVAAPAAQAADNVVPIRPDQADIETKVTPIKNFLRDQDGSMYMGGKGGKGPKYKTKEEALRKIFDASGVDGMRNQSAKAGHFNEIERIVGRKVKGTQDAFNALSAMSAKKRGKSVSDRDWEDVQTAIRELKQIEGLEDLKLPVDVQEALLPVQPAPDVPPVDEPSFNFGFNAKAKAKDPEFLAKSQDLADMLAAEGDTAITPVDMRPNSIHENATPNQIQDGAKYAEAQGLDPDVPLSAQGGPHIKHKGTYRDKGYSFPKDKAGWENEPHWWKAGEDDSEPGGIMEMMMRETETPQEAAAWEALNKNERNASKWRNPSDVDSSVGRRPAAFPEPVPMSSFDAATKPRARASADMPTNAKGGGADLYDPMGLGDAPNVRPSDAELFADVRAKAARAGKPDFSAAREATAGEEALWGEALNRMRAKGLINNVEDAGKLGTRVATNPGAPFPDPITMTKLSPDNTAVGGPAIGANRFAMPPPAALMPSPSPMPGNDAAQIASGKDRIRSLLGQVGKYSGAAGGFQSGGIMGAIGGAQVGAKSLPRSFDMMDKGADKLHALGQKLLTDPAKLQQMEMQGGQMGKAASFVMEGAKTGGEAAMAARAYIISSQPWWREQFAEDEQEANQY